MSARDQVVASPDSEIARRLVDSGEPDLIAVIYEAGRRRLRSALPDLLILLRSPDSEIQLSALEALGEIGDATAGERILELLRDQPDQPLRDTAAWTLGLLRYRPGVHMLTEMLLDPEPTVRSCSTAALVAIGDKAAYPAVRFQLAREGNEAVRRDLLAALERLTPNGSVRADAAQSQVHIANTQEAGNDAALFAPVIQPLPPMSRHG